MLREVTDWVKGMYGVRTAKQIAAWELEDSQRRLLDAETSREYASAMCGYYKAKIERLTAYLHTSTEVKQ